MPVITAQQLIENVQVAVHSVVAELIDRSNNKNNRVLEISAKTVSSIRMVLYTDKKEKEKEKEVEGKS